MIADHLDELHGILHSFHYDDDLDIHFLMRWNLLTGAIERIDTDLGAGSYRHLVFAPELNAYVVISSDRIHLLSVTTGLQFDSRPKDHTNSKGAFVAGCMIGVVFQDKVRVWDYLENEQIEYGSEGSTVADTETDGTPKAYFGFTTCAAQNTWTGQVAVGGTASGNYNFVTFIPSAVEPKQENTACASPDVEDFTPYDTLLGRKWVRDWSYRKPDGIKLRLLEGESSVAASLYAMLFNEPSFNSERWGGGIDPSFASLPSFESLHARCVAPERYLRSNSGRWETGLALKKAYEFDMKSCGGQARYTESFEPDDTTPYTWRSAEGGVLWLNTTDSPLYEEDIGKSSGAEDDKFILRTAQMIEDDHYMKAGRTASMSPPTSTSEWSAGYNSSCLVGIPGGVGFYRRKLQIDGIRAKTRAEDPIEAPEQAAEAVYMERYKADYVLDAQSSLAAVVDDIFLAACNGYRTMIDGKLHVGINPPGRLAMMNLTDDMRQGSGSLTLASGQQPNLIVLQFANRFDDYRQDFQQAGDDFDAEAKGQTIIESPNNPGITRPGQAQKIVGLMRDIVASHSKQYTATYKFTGLILSPGDCVAIWDRECGLAGDLFIVNNWEEVDDQKVKLTCTEHVALTPGVRQADAADPPVGGTGGNPPLEPGKRAGMGAINE
jgi:hypothetical protein